MHSFFIIHHLQYNMVCFVVPDTAPYTINLSAGNDPVVLTPPNFPSAYQGLRDYTWLITAESKRKIVTIEVIQTLIIFNFKVVWAIQ